MECKVQWVSIIDRAGYYYYYLLQKYLGMSSQKDKNFELWWM